MNIYNFLSKKLGIDTISSKFYDMVYIWQSWYQSNVSSFHRYKVYNGHRDIQCRRMSLSMASQVSKDMADLLLNEKVQFTIDDEATDAYIKAVLEANQWQEKANEYQELKAALGTVAYVLQLDDVETDQDGNIIRGTGNIRIDYVRALNIFPITWSNGVITECVFRFQKTIRGKVYYHLQVHKTEAGNYVIENHVVQNTEGNGKEVDPSMWADLPPFAGMSPRIETQRPYPQFVIDKLNLANPFVDDDENPMGMSLFYDALDVLETIDTKYDSYRNEFGLGKKRIFVAPEMIEDKDGNAIFDENDTVFYQLPEDGLAPNESMHEVNMELRVDEHSKGITDSLNLLSMKCGFGMNRYKFENGSIQTATQVISENSDLYRTVCKHELPLDKSLKDLCRTITRLGVEIGVPGINPDADIVISFDDSIIEDKQAERATDRSDVAMGAMSLVEYRMKWYGETEEEAKKHVVEDTGVIE